jgi:DNA-binding SARP family transcriptional activator
MQTPVKWWNKWWDHFFQPPKPKVRKIITDPITSKQLPVFDLRIQLLGSVKWYTAQREIPDMTSPQHTLLLAYFARHAGQKIRRDELIGQFWPEVQQESARNSLNVALCHIRRHFRKYLRSEEQIIIYQRGCYRFHPEWVIQTDVQRFEQYLLQARELKSKLDVSAAFKCYRKATQLYQGNFLEAFPYEAWATGPREQLKEKYLHALDEIGQLYLQRQDNRSAQAIFRKILQYDAYLERAHQWLMWCYAKEGQRDLAIRQYRKCQNLLREEFGLEPSAETQHLYQCLLRGEALQMTFLSRAS